MIDNSLHSLKLRQLADTSLDFKRYPYNEIPDARLVSITGLRVVGKSALMLQKIKESDKRCLYVDAYTKSFNIFPSILRFTIDIKISPANLINNPLIPKFNINLAIIIPKFI